MRHRPLLLVLAWVSSLLACHASPPVDAPPLDAPPPARVAAPADPAALGAPAVPPLLGSGRPVLPRAEVPAPDPGKEAPGFEYTTFETLAREPTLAEAEARSRAAFAALAPGEQKDVCDWLQLELGGLETFQLSLIRFMLANRDVSEGEWPEAEQPPWFDPETHAPKQPIPRHLLESASPEARAVRRQIYGNIAPRRLKSGWVYDYATRGLARLPDAYSPARIFENALLGMPPDWDLAEALVERALDDGSLQKHFAAFAHAYTDRDGGVYPGVTLYDAWASRTQIEMPDVDTLGLIHDVLNDWQTWTSIVSSEAQPSLYGRLAELYQEAHHHRSLRHNLARAYLCGSTELRDSYQHNLDRFHTLWESARSNPAELAGRLPDAAHWAEFLQGWSDQLDGDVPLFLKGVNRHFTLDNDAQLVRQKLLWVLDQYGAYQRLDAAEASARGQ